jgi:tetratricopeptide (TPR) repeat protein
MNSLKIIIKLQLQDSFKKKNIMKKNILLCLLLTSILSINGYTQKKTTTNKKESYEKIDLLKTYERVSDKGYKSIDMLKKLGNASFFDSDFEKGAKWYSELFTLTTNLEPEYYYRYSQCLKAIGQHEKANQMLDIFNTKSGNDK